MVKTATLDAANIPEMPVARRRVDGNVIKFCLRTGDDLEIESVIIPMGAADKTWRTLCVSSQVGCGRGCTFCQTARMGLLRNLSAGEILGQVRAARSAFGANVRNVVFMGMGEPMDNLDNVIAAIIALHEDHARQIPRRRITVSTVGRCAGIRRLAALGWRRLNLAVSLNAPNDEIRSRIMPINRAEPMAELRRAIAAYPVRAGGHVLIEYVLIKGLNDRLEHAAELVEYLRGLRTCVNLIPMNPIDDEPFDAPAGRAKLPLSRSDAHDGRAKLPLSRFEAPDDETVERFQLALMNAGQLAFRRNTKGRRAMAACGQLGNPGLRRGSAQQPEVACVR